MPTVSARWHTPAGGADGAELKQAQRSISHRRLLRCRAAARTREKQQSVVALNRLQRRTRKLEAERAAVRRTSASVCLPRASGPRAQPAPSSAGAQACLLAAQNPPQPSRSKEQLRCGWKSQRAVRVPPCCHGSVAAGFTRSVVRACSDVHACAPVRTSAEGVADSASGCAIAGGHTPRRRVLTLKVYGLSLRRYALAQPTAPSDWWLAHFGEAEMQRSTKRQRRGTHKCALRKLASHAAHRSV